MDKKATWQQYKIEWAQSRSPAMDAATFNSLFYDGSISREAVELIKSSPYTRKTLDETTRAYPLEISSCLNDSDRWRVWFEVRGEQGIDRLIMTERTKVSGLASRASLVKNAATAAIPRFGRAWTRARVRRWWQESRFVEEEKEALLGCLGERNVLNWFLLNELGPDALETVKRLVRRGDLKPERIDGVDIATLRTIQGRQRGNRLGRRIGGLLHPVTIPLEIRDSCLQFDELAGVNGIGWTRATPGSLLLRKAIRRLREFHPMELEELSYALSNFGDQLLQHLPSNYGTPAISFPLIRFLHLRLLLESPSLGLGVTNPEEFLVPEVLTYTLGRDAVSYIPELRVFREMDRRWRARWAESAGEAMSVMFLESTVGIDLATLARIPETNDKETPDFQARTNAEEPIVFESKGATAWKTHRDQRNKALEQLGKRKRNSKSRKASKIAWSGSGRGFAISLFAAQQGDTKSSLLHVDDPPFVFDDLFPDGWEEEARRTHYRAVLETAQMFDAAEDLRQRRVSEVRPQNIHFFTIEGAPETQERMPRFVGTFLPTLDISRRMQHPDIQAVEALRVFVGVQEQIYDSLRRNETPHVRKHPESEVEADLQPPITVPPWGLLPGREPDQPPRGIYSSLSNGAFLAVELQ